MGGSPYSSDEDETAPSGPGGDDEGTDPTDILGPCGEAAPCFDDAGCSMFDRSAQTWIDTFAPCNEGALGCASFFPDSSCFSENGDSAPPTPDSPTTGDNSEGDSTNVDETSPVASPVGGNNFGPTS